MDTFLKNYWSLYNDFLITFDQIAYKGISLAYLCHLPSYITKDGPVWNQLSAPSFIKKINYEIHHQKEIQDKFNQFMQAHTKLLNKQQLSQGKVVIHVDKLLRFPPSTFMNHFNANNSMMLMTTEKKPKKKKKKVSVSQMTTIDGSKARKKYDTNPATGINQITTIALNRYKRNIDKEIIKIVNQTKALLVSYKNHPIYGSNAFCEWFITKIKVVMNTIEMTERFLKHNSVSCFIVSTTHSYINRILAVVGARKGIPSICMQHGIISSELGYIPKIATIDAVYGQFEIDWYTKLGVAGNAVRTIGHPRFDEATIPPKLTRKQFYRKLNLDLNKKTILLIMRENRDLEKWRKLIQLIKKKYSCNILINNYPSNRDCSLVRDYANVYSTQNYHHYNVFPHIDLVISYSSTVALEAMLAKKHVFILKDEFKGYTNYFSTLGNFVQSKPEQLAPYVLGYFQNPSIRNEMEKRRRKFLKYAYSRPDRSGERLAKLISRLTLD